MQMRSRILSDPEINFIGGNHVKCEQCGPSSMKASSTRSSVQRLQRRAKAGGAVRIERFPTRAWRLRRSTRRRGIVGFGIIQFMPEHMIINA
jgi:hypothetical protein